MIRSYACKLYKAEEVRVNHNNIFPWVWSYLMLNDFYFMDITLFYDFNRFKWWKRMAFKTWFTLFKHVHSKYGWVLLHASGKYRRSNIRFLLHDLYESHARYDIWLIAIKGCYSQFAILPCRRRRTICWWHVNNKATLLWYTILFLTKLCNWREFWKHLNSFSSLTGSSSQPE